MKDTVKTVIIGNSAFDVNTFLNRDGLEQKTVINNGGACLYSLIPASIFDTIGVVTRVGIDFNLNLLESLNIDTTGLQIIEGNTTKFHHTYFDKEGQERSFNPEVNEACLISTKDIPNEYLKAKYIHVATNFPQMQYDTVKYLKESSSAIISVDTHEAYVDDPKVLEMFNMADVAFIDKEFKNLYNCSAPIKILKLGKDGCKYVSKTKEFRAPAPKCDNVVDKTGAGDCVTGVFIALKSLGYSDEEALQRAVNIATESIKDYGVEHILTKKL